MRNILQKLLEECNCSLSLFYMESSKEIIVLHPYFICECIETGFNKTFTFVVIYFALITAFWTLVCCPVVGKHSEVGKYPFYVKHIAKSSVKTLKSKWIHFQSYQIFCVAINNLYGISMTRKGFQMIFIYYIVKIKFKIRN